MSILNELNLFAKNYSILIVEDDEFLNEELVDIASIFFKSVDFAFDGKEALEKYKLNSYDLILSDITMPKMNGTELSREIKNINRNQQIIVLSAHQEVKYLIELIDIGITQFVAKPFEQKELLYRLLKVCENIFYKDEYHKMIMLDLTKEKVEQIASSKVENIVPYNEKKVIEKAINHKRVDAKNFMNSIKDDSITWNAMENEIEVLFELSNEFNEQIERIHLNDISRSSIIEISIILRKMNSILSFTDVLSNLGAVLLSLAQFLENLDIDSLDETKRNKLKLLEFIYDDISRFIETVFVYEDTLDVFYLEDSLNSSVEQLKMNLEDEKIEEDELELF
jgi:YesN/AraC family two-component response regulator